MKDAPWTGLLLALYPTPRGFAFALFEDPLSPIDWGVKEVRHTEKNAGCLEAIGMLIERYHPDAIVIEDYAAKGSRRRARIHRLYRSIEVLAHSANIETYRYSRNQIRSCFGAIGAVTKQEIAHAISKLIVAFGHRLPPIRKIWMSEDPRMNLFDAAALALTFYNRESGQTLAA